MRRTLWITLLTVALAMGAFSSGARGAVPPMQGDCCESLCPDMVACANMLVCQACTAPTAHLAQHRALAFLPRLSFPSPVKDRAPIGPAPKIWTPPD